MNSEFIVQHSAFIVHHLWSVDMVTGQVILLWLAVALYAISTVLFVAAAVFRRSGRWLGWALGLAAGGLLPHGLAIILRWVEVGHGPYVSFYEIASSDTWVAVALFAFVGWRYLRLRLAGMVVLPVSFLLIGAAVMAPREGRELLPILRSYWLVLHVTFAKLAYGPYLIGLGAAVLYLWARWRGVPAGGSSRLLKDPAVLDELSYVIPAVTENNASTPTPTNTPTPANTPTPTVTPTPLGPAHGDGATYASTTDACAKCHRTHTAKGTDLRVKWPEEQVCFTCHDGTGAPNNIMAEFNLGFTHPITKTAGVHTADESAPSRFTGANRHVECEDCHNPHSAAGGNHPTGSSAAPPVLQGSWGISVTNGISWTAPTSGTISPVTQEYQLCFKCHSSWAYGSTPPTSHSGGIVETDQAKEFNVNNPSYHWVEGNQTASSGVTPRTTDGRNMTFVAGSGWTPSSAMTCTDCHASNSDTDPRGPHGSSNAYLLRGGWTTGSNYTLCFKCHDQTYYGSGGNQMTANKTGFSGEKPNLHTFHMSKGELSTVGCFACHSAVPHGGQYKSLLAPRELPDGSQPAADVYNSNSKLWIQTWKTSGNWTQNDCSIYPGGGH